MSTSDSHPPSPADAAAHAGNGALSELERQVERGSFYTHTAIGNNALRLGEVESFLYGAVDVLVAKGFISLEELQASAEKVRQEGAAQGDIPHAGVALRVDEPDTPKQPPVKVNCAERMHICHAVCCKLDFALTREEVEQGEVKWDLGRPYYIRHASSGFCVHNDRSTGCCSVYEDRPAICRGYSCAGDGRIWKDFEKMELNTEWLAENLSGSTRPRLVAMLMQHAEVRAAPEASGAPEEDQPGQLRNRNATRPAGSAQPPA